MLLEIVITFGILPITVNRQEINADIDTLTGSGPESDAFRKQLMNNPVVQRTIKHYLPIWDSKGLLDPLKPI